MRPQEGDFIKIWFVTNTDKEKKTRVKPLKIELTEEINSNLRKDISGILQVKYKNNGCFDDDWIESYSDVVKPDFAFINDYYVPKFLLEKHNVTMDCQVKAKVIFAGDKWKVYDIEIIQ